MIKETISANVSVSAEDADKIASILPFSVPIFPSKPEANASLWVWDDPDNVLTAVLVVAISDAKEVLIASLLTSAELLNAVVAEDAAVIVPVNAVYPSVAVMSTWPDPETSDGLLWISAKSVDIAPTVVANEELTDANSASVA